MPYFRRTGVDRFTPTEHVGGAWRPDEQHIAPALGLLVQAIEADHAGRRDDGLRLARVSHDILGVLPMDEVEIDVRVVRAGRTIELVEAVLSHNTRPAVLSRGWLLATGESEQLAGGDLPSMPAPDDLPVWDPTTLWPGGFIASVQVRRREMSPGRAQFWVRTDVPLLDEPTTALAPVAGLLDIANGMTVRADPAQVLFPNVDLTAHLFRHPSAGWLGFDTTVTFGPSGIGLTSSVLHDETGPFGTLAQSLTVRPTSNQTG